MRHASAANLASVRFVADLVPFIAKLAGRPGPISQLGGFVLAVRAAMLRAARFEFDSQTPSDFGSWSMDRQPIARILQADCVDSLVGPLRQGFLVAPHFEGKSSAGYFYIVGHLPGS